LLKAGTDPVTGQWKGVPPSSGGNDGRAWELTWPGPMDNVMKKKKKFQSSAGRAISQKKRKGEIEMGSQITCERFGD